jgi:hypothetical protein
LKTESGPSRRTSRRPIRWKVLAPVLASLVCSQLVLTAAIADEPPAPIIYPPEDMLGNVSDTVNELGLPIPEADLSDRDVAALIETAKRAEAGVQPVLVRAEKLIDGGITKLVTWTNQATGHVDYAAAVEPTTEVNLVSTGEVDGVYEIELRPDEPLTDAGMDAWEARMTPELFASRTKTLPALAAAGADDPSLETPVEVPAASVNRAAPAWALKPAAVAQPVLAVGDDGGNSTQPIVNTECALIDNSEAYAEGCYYLRRVPEVMDNRYLRSHSSYVSTHHKGTYGWIRWVKGRHDYDEGWNAGEMPGTQVVQRSPFDTINESNCDSDDVTVAWGNFSASMPVRLCPDKLDPFARDFTYFHHAWYGFAQLDGTDRGSSGHSIVKGTKGHGHGFAFRVAVQECDEEGPYNIQCDAAQKTAQ